MRSDDEVIALVNQINEYLLNVEKEKVRIKSNQCFFCGLSVYTKIPFNITEHGNRKTIKIPMCKNHFLIFQRSKIYEMNFASLVKK